MNRKAKQVSVWSIHFPSNSLVASATVDHEYDNSVELSPHTSNASK